MNNGPDDQGPDDQGPEELDSDELALRRLLHTAVQEIEPRDGTLDHLRRAVPARRARKRQALVGAAAAALFVGTAVPALVHVSNSTGSGVNASNAGHGQEAQGGVSQGKDTENEDGKSGGASDKVEDKDKGGAEDQGKGESTGSGSGSGSSADPPATSAAGVPACTSAELGIAGSSTDVPDTAGAVYGTFRFSNVSTAECAVTGPGSVTPLAQGAADPAKIMVARHVAGDQATSLPDPSLELASLVLKPGASYEVKFAWVPSETCPTNDGSGGTNGGGDPTPTPTPTPSQNTGTTEGATTTGETGTSPQLVTEDGTADGSVLITNTAEPGSPSIQVTVSNACAGTVYWTGVLAPTA
ncbi:hypothetical protein [Streptomyces dysideae]|uniref:DUF4232 domain-containing protein n=1 Tax=Streptomyces dysideae TaxID=909626 RepID=A0A101UU70_9ACTN|nr:hypothetical protein [Streptomyces dysideae]KUO16945.1 hypothetical protein AQJ91_33560 [Streptomyces dysideae]